MRVYGSERDRSTNAPTIASSEGRRAAAALPPVAASTERSIGSIGERGRTSTATKIQPGLGPTARRRVGRPEHLGSAALLG